MGSRSISRVLSAPEGAVAAIPLGDALPRRSSSLPGSSASHAFAPLFGLAPDGVYRAVRRWPRTRWALTPPFHPYLACGAIGGISLLPESDDAKVALQAAPPPDPPTPSGGTFRHLGYSARPLAGILLCGARTFLPVLAHRGGRSPILTHLNTPLIPLLFRLGATLEAFRYSPISVVSPHCPFGQRFSYWENSRVPLVLP